MALGKLEASANANVWLKRNLLLHRYNITSYLLFSSVTSSTKEIIHKNLEIT